MINNQKSTDQIQVISLLCKQFCPKLKSGFINIIHVDAGKAERELDSTDSTGWINYSWDLAIALNLQQKSSTFVTINWLIISFRSFDIHYLHKNNICIMENELQI